MTTTASTPSTSDHTSGHANATAYLDQRVAAAQTAMREAEEEQQRLREADRKRDREERIAHFRLNFEGYLNDLALQEALDVRFDADQPLSPSGNVTPYAAITVDDSELRIYSVGGGTYRVINPRSRNEQIRLLYEAHSTDLASGILLAIAAFRQREAERKQREAEEAARQAEIAEIKAAQAAQAAESPAPVEPPAATPAKPVARVIMSDGYSHTIELGLSAASAKVAVLHQFNGDVELIELTPRWTTDEQGHPTAQHFRLTMEQMEMLITAYTQQCARDAADATDATSTDDMPF